MNVRDLDSKNGIIGLAIGDALGTPFEHVRRAVLDREPITDMVAGGTHEMGKGVYSDDTALILATIDSILEKDKINPNDIGNRFIDWLKTGRYTATGKTFGVGRVCEEAITNFERGSENAAKCGMNGLYDNGNGSLMRILPLAYYIHGKNIYDDEEIYNLVRELSSITHAHEISIMACYIYVKFAIYLLEQRSIGEAYNEIQNLDYGYFDEEVVVLFRRIIDQNLGDVPRVDIKSTGYVVDTLEAALWVFLHSEDYNSSILEAVNLGDDTDTVGAVVGGLLGIYYGMDSIKKEWLDALIKKDYIVDMCDRYDKLFYRT